MYHVPLTFQCIYRRRTEGGENEYGSIFEEGIEWRLPGLLYADDLVLCGESEEGVRFWNGLLRCVGEED